MSGFEKLFEIRKSLLQLEKEFGIDNFSNLERSIFAYVANKENATLTQILNNKYFKDFSTSSIKRATEKLIAHELIIRQTSLKDKRQKLLTVKI